MKIINNLILSIVVQVVDTFFFLTLSECVLNDYKIAETLRRIFEVLVLPNCSSLYLT